MKKLIFNIFIFALPAFCWLLAEGLLPSNTFTYRPWEALRFQDKFRFFLESYFHPNQMINMHAYGELNHHTKESVAEWVVWKIDEYGNRNDSVITDPDIVIFGDSFVAGIRSTQDSTITSQLQFELSNKMKVYNFNPANFSIFDFYLKYNLIKKPKLVIFERGERDIPKLPASTEYPKNPDSPKQKLRMNLKLSPEFMWLYTFADKVSRMYGIQWLKSRLRNNTGLGVPGKEGTNMYFLDGFNRTYASYNHSNLEQSVRTISMYKEYCDSLGIDFLFVPMPNKETVYYDYVPFNEQPDYLFKLDSLLRLNKIPTVNTLKIYNDYREKNGKLLYHLDDTHWTPTAIKLVARDIASKVIQNKDDGLLVQGNN